MSSDKKIAFDPWTATEEEACAAYFEKNPNYEDFGWNGSYQGHIMYQWWGVQLINSQKDAVMAGDGRALMDCMAKLVVSGLVAPDWLARAFNQRYEAVQNYDFMSWDEAFGKPHPPKTKQLSKRKALVLPFIIWQTLSVRLYSSEKSISDLLEEIAKELGISKTEAETHYYKRAIKRFGKPFQTSLGKRIKHKK